jgi:hypothetical protein
MAKPTNPSTMLKLAHPRFFRNLPPAKTAPAKVARLAVMKHIDVLRAVCALLSIATAGAQAAARVPFDDGAAPASFPENIAAENPRATPIALAEAGWVMAKPADGGKTGFGIMGAIGVSGGMANFALETGFLDMGEYNRLLSWHSPGVSTLVNATVDITAIPAFLRFGLVIPCSKKFSISPFFALGLASQKITVKLPVLGKYGTRDSVLLVALGARAEWKFTPHLGIFASYRYTRVEDAEFKYKDSTGFWIKASLNDCDTHLFQSGASFYW